MFGDVETLDILDELICPDTMDAEEANGEGAREHLVRLQEDPMFPPDESSVFCAFSGSIYVREDTHAGGATPSTGEGSGGGKLWASLNSNKRGGREGM